MTREQLIIDLELFCGLLDIYYEPNFDGSTPGPDWFKALVKRLKEGEPID